MIFLQMLFTAFLSFSWAGDRTPVDCASDRELCREAYNITRIVSEKSLKGQVEGLSGKDLRSMKDSIGNGSLKVDREELERAPSQRERNSLMLKSLMDSSGIGRSDDRLDRSKLMDRDDSVSEKRRDNPRILLKSSTSVRGGICGPNNVLCSDGLFIEEGFWD